MNLLDQLASMAIFARIAETGSYTEAAQRLGLSKSALSKEIVRLETSLGATLLRRTTRRVEVTEIGRAYYEYCARVLTEADSARTFVQRCHEEPSGNLRASAPTTFGNRVVVPALCDFLVRNVQVRVDLELTDRLVDLNEENLDLAIVISRAKPERVLSRPLMPIEWGLYATPAYLENNPPIRTPQDLPRHGFLSFHGPARTPVLQLRRGKRQVDLQVRHLLRSNNSLALLHAALSGIGVAYLPRYAAGDAQRDGTLTRVLPDWLSETHMAYVTFREDRFLSPRVRLFVEHLANWLADRADVVAPAA